SLFTPTPPTYIHSLSLHDALPILKPIQLRQAVASGEVRMQHRTLKLIESEAIAKGNVLATARIAGIMAAKKTGELIPLCHPLPIDRKSTRLNSSHEWISYAVFCLK